MLVAATVGLAAACGGNAGGGSPVTTAGPDAADCSGGATATRTLQETIRQLTDSLNAIGPASERNDLTAVLAQLDTARGSADRISGGLGAAAAAMTPSSLVRTEFQQAAASGAGLRDTLDGLRGVLTGDRPQGDETAQLQNSVTGFNTAVERVSLACSNVFSAATVEPTTTVVPTRTTR